MWAGTALIRPGWAVFRGTAGEHARHRHHAVQIAVGLDGPVEVWASGNGPLEASAIIVGADCLHQVIGGLRSMMLIYIERESSMGRVLDQWCGGGVRALSDAEARTLALLLDDPDALEAGVNRIVPVLVGEARPGESPSFSDARIAQSIESLPKPIPDSIPIEEVAARCGLSTSRYAHLFKAHTGMPWRPYLRWRRLQDALAVIAGGANLTEGAYAAGFADSAHLSRTFRRTFGIAPQVLLKPALKLSHAAA